MTNTEEPTARFVRKLETKNPLEEQGDARSPYRLPGMQDCYWTNKRHFCIAEIVDFYAEGIAHYVNNEPPIVFYDLWLFDPSFNLCEI